MITDIAVERVKFRCPESHWQSVIDYDVVLYVDAEGDAWEFYSMNGVPTPSPYTVDGAPFCPICHRVVVGTPVARRFIPVPPGDDHRPRQPVSDLETHRAQRYDVSLLSATSTPYPNQSADPDLQEHTMSHSEGRVPETTASGIMLIFDPKTMWPLMALRGVLAILFGIAALVWPGITVIALALLFAVWAFLDGGFLLINAYQQGRAHASWRDWLPSLLAGLLGIAAAVVTVLWPGITILVLTILAGILLIAVGVAEIALAVGLRRLIRGEIFLALAGLAGIIAGILILIWPLSGALVLTIMLGAYALVSGILLLVVAWRLRRLARSSEDVTRSARAGAGSARRPQPRTP